MNRLLMISMLLSFIGCSLQSEYKVAVMYSEECFLFVDQNDFVSTLETNDSILCLFNRDSIVFHEFNDSIIFLFYDNHNKYQDVCTGISYSESDTSNISHVLLRYTDKESTPAFVSMSKEILIGNSAFTDTVYLNNYYCGNFVKKSDYNELSVNDWVFSVGYHKYQLETKDSIYLNMVSEHNIDKELIMKITIDKRRAFITENIKGTTWYVMDSLTVKRGIINNQEGLVPVD